MADLDGAGKGATAEAGALVDLASADDIIQTAELGQIRHTLLGNQVYDLLWQRIVDHQLHAGDKLSDVRLSEELGVSRTPVREALYRLVQDGIAHSKSRHGFFVAHFSSPDVSEIYDVRCALEVLAVRLALPNLRDAELEEAQHALDEVQRTIQEGAEGGGEAFLEIDRAFHALLLRAANNRRLQALMTSLQGQLRIFQYYGIHVRHVMQSSMDQHQAILAAMRRRDGPAAEAAMERHIQDVKERVLREFVQTESEIAGANGEPR